MDRKVNVRPDDLFDLSGKVALVNGASRGIGESCARALAAYGAKVIVSSRKLEACEAVAASIRDAGGQCEARACHAGDLEQLQALFAGIERDYGRLDVQMNNAVASPYYGHICDTDLASFDKVVDVNIKGCFYACVYGAKLMAKNGGGSIINTASVFGLQPGAGEGAAIYSISKGAIITLTKAFASECADMGVRVNALLPGLTQTKFAGALLESDSNMSAMLPRIPLKRVAQPDEMAGAVVYLASNASSYATGSLLIVDGGYSVY